MTGNIIKSFLVGLGFDVDDSSLAKFNKAIATAGLRVAALYASIKLTTAGIVYGIAKISEGFEQIGYEYRIIAPMINKTLVMRRELLKAYAAAGINITKVVQASVKLNMSLYKTKIAFEAIYRSVASRFFGLITKQSDLLRKRLYENMPKIQDAIERFVKFVFKAFEATVQLGARLWSVLGRVYTFFTDLDHATNGWSTKILGLVAAWKLLNLSFLATPLGMLLTGLVALLALFDDFKTYQEGGKSLINWGPFVPTLVEVGKIFDQMAATVVAIAGGLNSILHGDWAGLIGNLLKIVDAFSKINTSMDNIVRGFHIGWVDKILNWRDRVDSAVLGVGGQNNTTSNQHVQQQTQIHVSGSADAGAVGKAVAGEQNRVNFDMVRNLKGATR